MSHPSTPRVERKGRLAVTVRVLDAGGKTRLARGGWGWEGTKVGKRFTLISTAFLAAPGCGCLPSSPRLSVPSSLSTSERCRPQNPRNPDTCGLSSATHCELGTARRHLCVLPLLISVLEAPFFPLRDLPQVTQIQYQGPLLWPLHSPPGSWGCASPGTPLTGFRAEGLRNGGVFTSRGPFPFTGK